MTFRVYWTKKDLNPERVTVEAETDRGNENLEAVAEDIETALNNVAWSVARER